MPEEGVDGIQVRRFRNISNSLAYCHNIFLSPGMLLAGTSVSDFDVIHMHEYRTFQNALVHHYARKYGIPYLVQAHGALPRTVAKQRLKQFYDAACGYRTLRDAARVIALTETEASHYASLGVDEDRIEILPNGIDLGEFETLPERGEFRGQHGLGEAPRTLSAGLEYAKIRCPEHKPYIEFLSGSNRTEELYRSEYDSQAGATGGWESYWTWHRNCRLHPGVRVPEPTRMCQDSTPLERGT